MSGMLRVIMKPLIAQIPLVGGVQIFFLNSPSVDFNLIGVVDVLDMPGLKYLAPTYLSFIFRISVQCTCVCFGFQWYSASRNYRTDWGFSSFTQQALLHAIRYRFAHRHQDP